jgi:glycosyltransferase involved in cell wall biosynthesis
MNKTRWLAIAWAPNTRRSEVFARELEARLYCIHYLRFQSPAYAPLKYPLQAVRTLFVLFSQRPETVHVQNPPFVCAMVVYIYCMVTRGNYVLDHHSAAFASIWAWALPIQKFLARRAVTNIVTNQHWARIIESWGGHALIMGDPFLELPPGEEPILQARFNVVFVSTFAPDEPLEAVVEAARQLPGVFFYVTGNPGRKPKNFFEHWPDNITCTGFLPDPQYIGLLRKVDAIMVLSRRDHTLQLGGCEAVAVCQPLITSNWPFLRDFFHKGTIYVANTPSEIRTGIIAMQRDHQRLKIEMALLRQSKRQEWRDQLNELLNLMAAADKTCQER